ncbi:MAG: dihydroorotate dehydrogenase electron transfer subunit [Deltaproteobacteria bacterium]
MPGDRMRFLHGTILRNEVRGGIFYRLVVGIPEPVRFVPGQFAMVSGWPGNDPLLPRPLAVFRSGTRRGAGTVEFVYKVVGRGTALLSGLHPGDPLALTLPLGRGFDLARPKREYWLVGGGVGFSSVFPAAAALVRRRVPFELFLGAKTAEHLPPREWTPGRTVGRRLQLCTEDGTAGFRGRVTDAVLDRLGRLSPGQTARLTILACGPWPMLRELARQALASGVSIQVGLENHMACGFGVCWGCVVALRDRDGTAHRRVCREGPVFDGTEVVW